MALVSRSAQKMSRWRTPEFETLPRKPRLAHKAHSVRMLAGAEGREPLTTHSSGSVQPRPCFGQSPTPMTSLFRTVRSI